MLRYSKTLSLALLFSISAIAMENEQQVDTLSHKDATAVTSTSVPTDLLSTLSACSTLDEVQEELSRLEKEKQRIEEQRTAALARNNKTLAQLLEKKKDKEEAVSLAQKFVTDLGAQVTALQLSKDKRAAEIAAEKELQLAALAKETETKTAELNKQKDAKTKEQKDFEAELTNLQKAIDKVIKKDEKKEEAPKKGGFFFFKLF